jgi:cob(I)alamin adenosyltransferase
MVHVYTGGGKGKTTTSIGIALRAIGHGLNVYIIQFMKGGDDYGEIIAAKEIKNLTILQFGRDRFVNRKNPDEIDIELAKKGLEHAKEVMNMKRYDIIVLDEINVALDYGLIRTEEVTEMIKNRPESVELVLTGRRAPKEIIELGDYVTEMREIKHPYKTGISARAGIEY